MYKIFHIAHIKCFKFSNLFIIQQIYSKVEDTAFKYRQDSSTSDTFTLTALLLIKLFFAFLNFRSTLVKYSNCVLF